MPGCTVDHNNRIITVTQSWLKDYLHCPERARRQINRQVPTNNDATARGHAVHRYMERRLQGERPQDALESAMKRLVSLYEAEDFVWEQVKKPVTLERHVMNLCAAFERHVLRQVPAHGSVEHSLSHQINGCPYDSSKDGDGWYGWDVYLTGTPDYTAHRVVWDWKSSARWWDRYETRAWDIQSIAYTLLWSLTLAPVVVKDFTFVVGVVPHGELQIIDLERGEGDFAWLIEVIRGVVSLIDGMGADRPWPVNHQHWLCSPRWCPFWSTCRGQYITPEEEEPTQ